MDGVLPGIDRVALGIGRLSLERATDTVTGGTREQNRLKAFERDDHDVRGESDELVARPP